jgi:phosphatidylinositol alpha-1,6-mannosyltransferase
MDILIVTQDFPPERGGIQTYVLELARAFLAGGHKVRVICPGGKEDPNPLPGLSDLVRIPVHSSWLFLPLLRYLPRYLSRNPSVDRVIYAQWQPALAELLMHRSKGKRRSYCLVHGRELLTSVLGPLAPFFMRRVFSRLSGAFPNSAEVMRIARERTRSPAIVGSAAFHLVHPGVDPAHFRPMDAGFLRDRHGLKGKPVILCITRMVARKNLRRLIEAMPGVRAEVPGAVLLLGGSGPEKEALESRARELELEDAVRFLGRIADDELVAHYSLADVFALPSLSTPKDIEGFGIVFLEAGACGVAVVGSLAGGIPDAVEDGVTGLLAPPEDLQKLTGALVELLKNRERARSMGERARKRIESGFTWKHTADRILDFMA